VWSFVSVFICRDKAELDGSFYCARNLVAVCRNMGSFLLDGIRNGILAINTPRWWRNCMPLIN